MSIDERELYEHLGLEAPEEPAPAPQEGAEEPVGEIREQETQEEPAEDDAGTDEGNRRESGAQASSTKGEDLESDRIHSGPVKSKEGDPGLDKVQTREERARFAAMRRKAEMDAAVARARQDAAREAQEAAQRTIDEAFKASGMVDPYTGKPITSKAEYDAYRVKYDEERKAAIIKKAGITEAEFDALVAAQAAKLATGKQQGQDRRESGAQVFSPTGENLGTDRIHSGPLESNGGVPGRSERAAGVTQEQVDSELQEIHKLDPSVSSLEEVLALETGEAFRAAVMSGHSFIDAFKLANFDRLQAQRQQETAQRAAQQARNNTRSKEHLAPVGSRGKGAEAVPKEELEMFRLFNPNATEEQIQAYYNKELQNRKR